VPAMIRTVFNNISFSFISYLRLLNIWGYHGSRNLQIAFFDYYRELTCPPHKMCFGRREFATTVILLIFQRSLSIILSVLHIVNSDGSSSVIRSLNRDYAAFPFCSCRFKDSRTFSASNIFSID
jgi:hypothetical protein